MNDVRTELPGLRAILGFKLVCIWYSQMKLMVFRSTTFLMM